MHSPPPLKEKKTNRGVALWILRQLEQILVEFCVCVGVFFIYIMRNTKNAPGGGGGGRGGEEGEEMGNQL